MKRIGIALVATLAFAATAIAAGPPACEADCAIAFVPPSAEGRAGSTFGITRGPLGSMWFGLRTAIGRIDRQGDMTTYPVPTSNANVGWMTTGPESTVWFAERLTGKVGTIDASGAIREYALPTPTAIPQGIVFAPDGYVYVSEQGANAIARLDPITGAAADLPVPTPNSGPQSGALGADGAIWFVERAANKIGRMSLDGAFTEYPLPAGAFAQRIIAGPDGALWFTELGTSMLGRIATDGTITHYPVAGGPVGITVGRDRQLYVVLFRDVAVARVNLDGVETGRWALPGAVGPLQLATGFGLDLWVADSGGGTLYRVTPYAVGR